MFKEGEPRKLGKKLTAAGLTAVAIATASCGNGSSESPSSSSVRPSNSSSEQPSDAFFGYKAAYQSCATDGSFRVPVYEGSLAHPKLVRYTSPDNLNRYHLRANFEISVPVRSSDGQQTTMPDPWEIVRNEKIPNTVFVTFKRLVPEQNNPGVYTGEPLDENGKLDGPVYIPAKCVASLDNKGQELTGHAVKVSVTKNGKKRQVSEYEFS